jgi:hypothetical protein
MEIRPGMQISELLRVGRPSSSPHGNHGEKSITFYEQGTPEFDTYAASAKEFTEKTRRLFSHYHEDGLPKNFLLTGRVLPDGSTTEMNNRLDRVFTHYYTGQVNERAVKDTISQVVAELRSNYCALGLDETKFMPKLIEDVYETCRLFVVGNAGSESWMESRKYAELYNGHDGNTCDWIYYDSKYYFSSEAMKNTLRETAQTLGDQYGCPELKLPTTYSDNDPRRGIYSSYNTYINNYARSQWMIGNMIDESMVPPENFRFFYKANESGNNHFPSSLSHNKSEPESQFDSVLHVWYGDWSYTGRVPVRFDATKNPVSVNMLDTIRRNSKTGVPSDIVDFLKNFDFFTSIQCGAYTNANLRRI